MIVPKKNGVCIQLCIDYNLVNAVTASLEYAMPLVDILLNEIDSYQWLCSLDASSGVWAVMLTERASHVSAFLYSLRHFDWF